MLGKLFKKKTSKKRILVAEDEKNIRKLIMKHLEVRGYEVEGAEDGQVALGMLIDQDFDMLFTDIMMPNVHGLDLIKHFRQDNPTTPVIVVSGKGSKEMEEKVKSHYDDVHFFKKPFKAALVIKTVEQLIGAS